MEHTLITTGAAATAFQPQIFQPGQSSISTRNEWASSTNIYEDEEFYKIYLSVTTLDEADLTIEVNKGILDISIGTFNRTFLLPKQIFEDDITASFSNGILQIIVPKIRPWSLKSSLLMEKRG